MIRISEKAKSILLAIGFLFIVFLLWYFSAIVTYVLVSVVMAFIGKPLVRWMIRIRILKWKIPKGVAALLTLFVLWIVFVSFFWFVIPMIASQLNTLSEINFTDLLTSIQEPAVKFLKFLGSDPVELEEQTFIDLVVSKLGGRVDFSGLSNLVGMIAGAIGELFIAFFSVSFITFFFMKEENMFREVIILLVPTSYEEKVNHILDSISYLLRRYFLGLILEVFMVMLLNTVGLTIVGIDFNDAVVIGLICGLFNVIPYLGPWMGAAIGILIAAALNINADFMSHTLPLMGLMVVVFGTVQVIDNILFQPLIYSSSVKAHPMEIFLVILVAGSLAGILGMILAIPVYTILRVIAKEFFDNMKIVRKITMNLKDKEQ